MHLRLHTPPATEPIDAATLASDLAVIDDDVAMLATKVAAARRHVESHLGRALISQTWTLTLPAFPIDTLRLPRPPFQSIDAVRYRDPDGAVQTYDDLIATRMGDTGYVWSPEGRPATARRPDAVEIDFVAGYGDTADAVPADILEAIRQLAAHMYEHRESVVVGSIATVLPYGTDALLEHYRERAF